MMKDWKNVFDLNVHVWILSTTMEVMQRLATSLKDQLQRKKGQSYLLPGSAYLMFFVRILCQFWHWEIAVLCFGEGFCYIAQ
jgi:hypothetical protein